MSKILKFKNSLDYYLKLFDTRKKDNDLLGALDACRSALTNSHTRIERDAINILLGQVYFEMQHYQLSCEYYFRAVKVPQSRASAYFGIGRNLVMLKKYSLALEYFDSVLFWDYTDTFTEAVLEWVNIIKDKLNELDNPQNISIKIKNNLANIFRVKKYNEMSNYLKDLLDLYPQDTDYKIMQIECHLAMRNFSEARSLIFELLREYPQNVDVLIMSCKLCLYDNDETNLREYLSIIDKIEVKTNKQLFMLGCIHFDIGEYQSAINDFLIIISKNEYKPKLLLYIAICYYNLSDFENALYYVARARWIDFENATLIQFYSLFREQKYDGSISLSEKLPLVIQQQKYELVVNFFNSENFINEFLHSITVLDDIEWSLTLSDFELTNLISNRVSIIKQQKAVNFFAKTLISTRPATFQKFLFAKYALRSGNYKFIDLTSNYRFRSFSGKMSKAVYNNDLLRSATSNARAYLECYTEGVDIIEEIKNISKAVIKMGNDLSINENTLTCAYFYQKKQVLFDACIYFGVDIQEVENVLHALGVN